MSPISSASAAAIQVAQASRPPAPPQPPVQTSSAPTDKDGDHDGSTSSRPDGVNILA